MKLVKEGNMYGIEYCGNIIVPIIYEEAKNAIAEWKWFAIDNNKKDDYRKYLPKDMTIEEIETIESELLNSI